MLVPLLPVLLVPLGVGASPAAGQAERAAVERRGVSCSPEEFVALAPTPGGAGYWVAGADGEVTAFGDAPLYGTAAKTGPSTPVVALVPSATGKGYWLVGRDGQVVSYGDAGKGSAGPISGAGPSPATKETAAPSTAAPSTASPSTGSSAAPSAAPVVAAARAGTSGGLWLAAADGTVRSMGGAALHGSAAGTGLSRPISAIVSSPSGRGYWLVGQDGRVLAFGDARPVPGGADLPPSQPVVAAARAGSTHGLWLTTADGTVHARGGAPSPGSPAGSAAGSAAGSPAGSHQVIGIASTPTGAGYWQLGRDGAVLPHGAPFFGTAEPSCEADLRAAAKGQAGLVPFAQSIMNGQAQPPWTGGAVPYSWGGGHGRAPGPSKGTCVGYTGSIRPCPADRTVGVDCSGLSRWVYRLAFGSDVLGAGNTNSQVRKLTRVTAANARAGDLVYFGTINSRTVNTHHVGVYIGNGQMINAARTGTVVRVDKLAGRTVAGYYRYQPSAP